MRKGGHLKNLSEDFENLKLFGVDITALSLEKLDIPKLKKKVGGLTNIPYKDDFFDVVYTCEALEHAIDIESAVKELSRVTRRGGIIIIIDKYLESGNKYLIERWEQFFDEYELKNELEKYCSEVSIVHGIGHDETLRTMSAWIGRKN